MNYKEQINEFAKEYFNHLDVSASDLEIGRTISRFEAFISIKGLSDSECTTTHSNFLSIPLEWKVSITSLAEKVAEVYGTRHIELVNHSLKEYRINFSFVGDEHDVHACYVSLKKLFDLAKEVRKTFIASRKKNMKAKNKEEKADNFMIEWVEKVKDNIAPTALIGENDTYIDNYINENFETEKEYNELMLSLANLAEMIIKAGGKAVIGDVLSSYKKKYNKDIQTIKNRLDELKGQYLLLEWPPLIF
jgi:hypothetical protein